MYNSTDTESENVTERRVGRQDRRFSGERRNEERLNHMKGEYRSSRPRRESYAVGKMVEGNWWWSGG
ncbi:MAG: hypothetical protein PF589_01005 [Gammaproteobacteria bacterium]|jgi:hypothetical protein|nr:hypothetical protein [Gammaproteobacteria bacterium]